MIKYFSKRDRRFSPSIVDNFHTGFVICDLIHILSATTDCIYRSMALKCLSFYSTMFDDKGVPSYTPFKRFPTDIYDCAIGIITFAKASNIHKSYVGIAIVHHI